MGRCARAREIITALATSWRHLVHAGLARSNAPARPPGLRTRARPRKEQVFHVRPSSTGGIAGGAVIVPALLAAAALAAAPIKGATYRGTLSGARAKITIRFRVSAGATQVQNLRIAGLPIFRTLLVWD